MRDDEDGLNRAPLADFADAAVLVGLRAVVRRFAIRRNAATGTNAVEGDGFEHVIDAIVAFAESDAAQ